MKQENRNVVQDIFTAAAVVKDRDDDDSKKRGVRIKTETMMMDEH
jgi:hypothetical protein